jgi:hypothetical protein
MKISNAQWVRLKFREKFGDEHADALERKILQGIKEAQANA